MDVIEVELAIQSAIKPVIVFLLLYFTYYYALRFIQLIFQSALGSINPKISRFIYILSTPAHELAHLLVAIICLAKIEKVQLFPKGDSPGFVLSKIGSSIPFFKSIKAFFISIAPALINIPLFIFIETKFVLKCEVSQISRILNPSFIFSKEGLITLVLFLIMLSGIAPSYQDLKGTIKGLIIFCVIIFGISYVYGMISNIKWVGIAEIIVVMVYYLKIILVTLIINSIVNYKHFVRSNFNILSNALKQTFGKN